MYLELRILRTRRDLYLSSTVNNTVSNISYLDTEFIFCLFKDKTTLRWFVVCNVPWLITCLKYQQDIKTEVSHTLWKCFKQNINMCIFESKLWCSTVINIRYLITSACSTTNTQACTRHSYLGFVRKGPAAAQMWVWASPSAGLHHSPTDCPQGTPHACAAESVITQTRRISSCLRHGRQLTASSSQYEVSPSHFLS